MLAEHRSYRRAAEALGIGQPALTRSIQALEASIGVPLFDRNPRGVALTRSGERLVAHAARVLAVAERMNDEISLLQNAELGEVRFGAAPFAGLHLVPRIVHDVLNGYPKLRIRVITGGGPELEHRLELGKIDFFIACGEGLRSSEFYEITHLRAESISAFVRTGHPLAHGDPLPLRDCLEYPLASVELPPQIECALARALGIGNGARVPFSVTSDSHLVLREVALNNDVILLAPDSMVRLEQSSGKLVRLAYWPAIETRAAVVQLRDRTLADPARLVLELVKLHQSAPKLRVAH